MLLHPKRVNFFPPTKQSLHSLWTSDRSTVQLTSDTVSLGKWLRFHKLDSAPQDSLPSHVRARRETRLSPVFCIRRVP